MLGNIELEILAALERGDSISDLAAKLDRSKSYVSRAVSALAREGLVHTERDERRKRVVPSDARAVELYQDLVRQHAHVDFPALLTETALEVLYYFDQPSTVSDLAARSDNYRNTVHRILKRLQHRGLVANEDGVYSFNDDFDQLHEFARALAHHRHRRRLESVAPRGTILWETDDEFLAQTATDVEDEHFLETGLARFADYGLQFLVTSHRYYFYSETLDSLSPADLCCHTLLIDDDSRHRSYCLLLLTVTDIEAAELRERAETYGLETDIDTLLGYLETEGDVEDTKLPPWSTFQQLAAEYEVNP